MLTAGLAPQFQIEDDQGRMDALTVRVEARPDTGTDRRAGAAAELVDRGQGLPSGSACGARSSTRRPWSARRKAAAAAQGPPHPLTALMRRRRRAHRR